MKKTQASLCIGMAALGVVICIGGKAAWEKWRESQAAEPGEYIVDELYDPQNIPEEAELSISAKEGEAFGSYQNAEGEEPFAEAKITCMEDTEDSDTILVYDGLYTPYSQQKVKDIEAFWEKKLGGIRVLGIEDEDGFMTGYYDPESLPHQKPKGTVERNYLGFQWTMDAKRCFYGGNILQLEAYSIYTTIQAYVRQSQKGKSYLVLKDHNTGMKIRILASETEDGWNGTIKMGSIPAGLYSIGIENASGQRITYEGAYGM